ncbi:MAG: hypothetical protein M3R17_01225 [Bacteroidota bacterium]|nr:hypothetical protein [Bacteroidota bacterium]
MVFRNFVIAFLFTIALPASAQKFTHIAKAHYVKFTSKEIYMLGYDVGIRRMCFSVSGGFGKGTDNQFLQASQINNGKEVQKVRGSQTIYPSVLPSDTYLESCVSDYKLQQLRVGFTVFIRRNDTLGRHPCTGLHFGVEAMYSKIIESQTVVYKSDFDETRISYSGVNKFNAFGAGTHIGWQFAFFSERLYIDLRAVIPFYYPFMNEPNLNSPFAGNKYELQGSIGWHFYRVKKEVQPEGDGGKVREKI